MSDIFNEVLKLGIKHDSHYSDLYIPKNKQTDELVKKYLWNLDTNLPLSVVTTFKSNLPEESGEIWYDLAFQFPHTDLNKLKPESCIKGSCDALPRNEDGECACGIFKGHSHCNHGYIFNEVL